MMLERSVVLTVNKPSRNDIWIQNQREMFSDVSVNSSGPAPSLEIASKLCL